MSSRIVTAFPEDKPMPANIFPDLNWISDNRLELYKKHGNCIVVVYQQEIIGLGKTRAEALNDAETHLSETGAEIPVAIGYISNPYRIGHMQRRVIEE